MLAGPANQPSLRYFSSTQSIAAMANSHRPGGMELVDAVGFVKLPTTERRAEEEEEGLAKADKGVAAKGEESSANEKDGAVSVGH